MAINSSAVTTTFNAFWLICIAWWAYPIGIGWFAFTFLQPVLTHELFGVTWNNLAVAGISIVVGAVLFWVHVIVFLARKRGRKSILPSSRWFTREELANLNPEERRIVSSLTHFLAETPGVGLAQIEVYKDATGRQVRTVHRPKFIEAELTALGPAITLQPAMGTHIQTQAEVLKHESAVASWFMTRVQMKPHDNMRDVVIQFITRDPLAEVRNFDQVAPQTPAPTLDDFLKNDEEGDDEQRN